MFTGLVETVGTIRLATRDSSGGRGFAIVAPFVADLTIGESVAVNGACLTVVGCDGDFFHVQAGPETLLKTTLGTAHPGDAVNLERALRLGDRLGGHLVTGHVDGLGKLRSRDPQGEWDTVWFDLPADLARQLVPKGSVAVDGVSLTVVEVEDAGFSVMLIPHTLAETTLGQRQPGDAVNIETDLIGKHVARLVHPHLPR